jgi:hypothetical protein
MLCRKRTHFKTPLARAAPNVEDALGTLERGEPVPVAEQRPDDDVLHVEPVVLYL